MGYASDQPRSVRGGGGGTPDDRRSRTARLADVGLRRLADLGANALFVAASTQGLVSVAAVLGSLYPVVTILLARAFLAERLRMIQNVGVVLALAGVVAIATG